MASPRRAVGARPEPLQALFRQVVDPKTKAHLAGYRIPGDGILIEFPKRH